MDLNIDQLFTADSLLTLQGAAAVAYLVPNVLGAIIPMPDRVRALLALIIALGLSFYAATLGEQNGMITWVVALLNGFLIAGSALGFNQITGGRKTAPQVEPAPAPPVPAPASAPGAERRAAPDDRVEAALPSKPAPQAPPRSAGTRGFRRSWL